MNRVADIMIIIMTVLAFLFPGRLINAIRATDEEKAASAKFGACVLFAAIVFFMGAVANS